MTLVKSGVTPEERKKLKAIDALNAWKTGDAPIWCDCGPDTSTSTENT